MSAGWDNVIAGNGIGLAVTGIGIIFISLLCLSCFIYLLPRVMRLLGGGNSSVSDTKQAEVMVELTEEEKQAAIALILHLELEYQSGESGRVTLRPHASSSIWSSSARMRSLSSWSHHA